MIALQTTAPLQTSGAFVLILNDLGLGSAAKGGVVSSAIGRDGQSIVNNIPFKKEIRQKHGGLQCTSRS